MPQTEWLEITEMCFLTALEAGSPKARCWQGLAPSETSREDAPSLPFPASVAPGVLTSLQSLPVSHGLRPVGLHPHSLLLEGHWVILI